MNCHFGLQMTIKKDCYITDSLVLWTPQEMLGTWQHVGLGASQEQSRYTSFHFFERIVAIPNETDYCFICITYT